MSKTKTDKGAEDVSHKSPSDAKRPSREQAEEAVRLLLRYIGDDPAREGLQETPSRVVRAYDEFFSGYGKKPENILSKTFEEIDGYREMVILRNIRLESHCEHHMVPIIGRVHIGYLPHNRVVGISKLARVVDVFAKRLQIQEKLTTQIAQTINKALHPHGVGVIIEANHHCLDTRGVHKPGSDMVTSCMIGDFHTNSATRREFLSLVNQRRNSTSED